jgi:hypothetical protein
VDSFFITALALAPTAEKYLVDIQRTILARGGCPSAFALPPVRPLFSGARAPAPETLRAIRGQAQACFTFRGYALREGVLCAEPSVPAEPAPQIRESPPPAAEPAKRLCPLPGFYLADIAESPGCGHLPALPSFTVRTLRLLVMELAVFPGTPWWRRTEWSILSEDWIKLGV